MVRSRYVMARKPRQMPLAYLIGTSCVTLGKRCLPAQAISVPLFSTAKNNAAGGEDR